MYKLEIFDNYGLKTNWTDLYYGIEKDYIMIEDVSNYVVKKMKKNENLSEEEIELAWNYNSKKNVLKILENVYRKHSSNSFEEQLTLSSKKWRYAIIMYSKNTIKNDIKLLDFVEELYETMDFPKDMESFIYYRQIEPDNICMNISVEERNSLLIKRLKAFLEKEKRFLITNNCFKISFNS